ncbi:MAG: YcgL domain-containing protein [Luteimonas sp.]|nr:YcgL domain-containing protein [Luteimonas sp.]
MHAYVYKSLRRADTYGFLAARDDFERLPEPLRTQLGPLRFVLDVALAPGRTLARENPEEVRANLAARGFHLQFPPAPLADPMQEGWGTDA